MKVIPLADAFHLFGYGVGQAQIIEAGVLVSTVLVVAYRLLTRGKRYPHG